MEVFTGLKNQAARNSSLLDCNHRRVLMERDGVRGVRIEFQSDIQWFPSRLITTINGEWFCGHCYSWLCQVSRDIKSDVQLKFQKPLQISTCIQMLWRFVVAQWVDPGWIPHFGPLSPLLSLAQPIKDKSWTKTALETKTLWTWRNELHSKVPDDAPSAVVPPGGRQRRTLVKEYCVVKDRNLLDVAKKRLRIPLLPPVLQRSGILSLLVGEETWNPQFGDYSWEQEKLTSWGKTLLLTSSPRRGWSVSVEWPEWFQQVFIHLKMEHPPYHMDRRRKLFSQRTEAHTRCLNRSKDIKHKFTYLRAYRT